MSFLPVYQALMDLERERNADVGDLMAEYPIAYPLMVGRVDAGDWSSTRPGSPDRRRALRRSHR